MFSDRSTPYTRIYSTVRGFLTPADTNAIQPAISNSGEVVYSGRDPENRQQIISTTRGHLTSFGGTYSVATADLPDIDSFGNVIFRASVNDQGGVYLLPTVLVVDIDIKPESYPNSINLRSKGVIPVAILSTNTAAGEAVDFDATQVDATTVRFGPNGTGIVHSSGHIGDVDGDSHMDLVVHFITQATGISCGETSASLTGETFGGQAIEGTDSIRTVGCKNKK